jgi:transposase
MNAIAYFNVNPESILYENIKTVVHKQTQVEIRLTRTFEDFLAYYPKACRLVSKQGKSRKSSKVFKREFFSTKE